eukprot:TRINITY_DN70898_c0_g1_i1.p1 TRINITY_DN70898_c0_g1~~TRINITY_DN70898_c0_g1_i1.p1  ORF type:complete len:295 (+),score=53.42 TRINITY_DN70898_c0_g1_i1:339-1223(+)
MKSPSVPVLSATLLLVFVLILFASGRYESLIPQLKAFEVPFVSFTAASNSSAQEASFMLNASDRKTCIVYERPPRTGSTTIGDALEKCLLPLGYEQPSWKGFDARRSVISDMLRLPFERVMVVSRHFYMNHTTLQHLRSGCESLLYITSTAPMKRRLWSLVKYRQFSKHGNASLNKQQVQSAIEDLKKEKQQLVILNAYPYLYNLSSVVDLEQKERIEPDYVIRTSSLVDDVSSLLRSFGCMSPVISLNIHRANHSDLLESVEIDDDDALYSRLTRYAEERNALGLKKAFDFGG